MDFDEREIADKLIASYGMPSHRLFNWYQFFFVVPRNVALTKEHLIAAVAFSIYVPDNTFLVQISSQSHSIPSLENWLWSSAVLS